jgi:hypothetical protein
MTLEATEFLRRFLGQASGVGLEINAVNTLPGRLVLITSGKRKDFH